MDFFYLFFISFGGKIRIAMDCELQRDAASLVFKVDHIGDCECDHDFEPWL